MNENVKPGSASHKSPSAENIMAPINQRRSRGTSCNAAARASSSAISIFHSGCRAMRPTNGVPGGTSTATMVSMPP